MKLDITTDMVQDPTETGAIERHWQSRLRHRDRSGG
jgi:hypothetical protein